MNKRILAQDDQWITAKPNGAGNTGRHFLLDDEGKIKAGAGGKFNGKSMGEVAKYAWKKEGESDADFNARVASYAKQGAGSGPGSLPSKHSKAIPGLKVEGEENGVYKIENPHATLEAIIAENGGRENIPAWKMKRLEKQAEENKYLYLPKSDVTVENGTITSMRSSWGDLFGLRDNSDRGGDLPSGQSWVKEPTKIEDKRETRYGTRYAIKNPDMEAAYKTMGDALWSGDHEAFRERRKKLTEGQIEALKGARKDPFHPFPKDPPLLWVNSEDVTVRNGKVVGGSGLPMGMVGNTRKWGDARYVSQTRLSEKFTTGEIKGYGPHYYNVDVMEAKTGLGAQDKALSASDVDAVKADLTRELAARRAAARAVKPICGELNPMAFDSVEAIYSAALKAKGIDVSKYPSAAWRGMLEATRASRAAPAVTADSAGSGFEGVFSGLRNISVSPEKEV